MALEKEARAFHGIESVFYCFLGGGKENSRKIMSIVLKSVPIVTVLSQF